MKMRIAAALFIAGLAGAASAQQPPKADPVVVAKIIADTFKSASDEWKARISPDETQQICSQFRDVPPKDLFDKVLAREKATLAFPADGKVLGDWRQGEKLAQRGTGGQFSDTAQTPKGGNCYACHQMTKAEISFGNIGPSLYQYGKLRGNSQEVIKYTWGKIWDSSAYAACSNMPRFGHKGILTEAQIRDVMALLLDPASPVNE